MAEEALESSIPKANFIRLTRLLIRGGENFLRETLDSFYSPDDLHLKLTHSGTEKNLNLSPPERACLYPSPGKTGESKDFDITLTFKLLKKICDLTEPPSGWNKLPSDSEETLEADLARINYYRNEVYAHDRTMGISDEKFVDLWKRIKEALLRIATKVCPEKRDEWEKSIDNLLGKSLTPDEERCIEELETWYMQDKVLKTEMENLGKDLKDMKSFLIDIKMHICGPNQATGSEPSLPEPEQAVGADDPEPNNPPDIDFWTVILSFKESTDLFLRYLRSKLLLLVRSNVVRSWHITVECSSLQVLEGLWEDYRSGHLNSVAQEKLITQQVLERLGLTELKLRTFISKDQYVRGKKLLEASSGAVDESDTQSAIQATITKAISEGSIEPDLLARISTLERENVELQEKVKVIHGTFRKERDLLATIPTLQHGNVELKAKVKALEETSGTDRDLLARISQLERENVELKEKVEAMDETFRCERGLLVRIPKLEWENFELMERMKAIERTFGSERDLLVRISQLELENVALNAKVKAMKRTFGSERDVLARMSKLEQSVELKERMEVIEQPLVSGRGIYSGQRYGFCQVIINRTTQEELVGEKDEIVHVFKMLNYRVDKATCTPSDDLKKLVQSIVARDYEHCDIFVCFILSNLTENMEMESVKGGAFNVRDLMDMFSPPNCPKLAGKPKVFIFLVHQKAAASESKYSIAEKLITEVPFYGLCLFVPYGKGYLSALLNEIMSRSLHLDLLTILKEAKKSFYKKTKITIPDPVHNFRGEVFLAV